MATKWSAVSCHHKNCRCAKVAQASRCEPRWNYRETPRYAIQIRQSPWHAENKKLSIRRSAWSVAFATTKASAQSVRCCFGLYDEQGLLNHVGFTSSFKSEEKKAITAKLETLIAAPGFTGDKPGGPSRWSRKRSAEWKPLKPRLVIEVCYDHFSDGRFRHGTRLIRWRPDKAPQQCTMDQVRQKKADLMKLLK